MKMLWGAVLVRGRSWVGRAPTPSPFFKGVLMKLKNSEYIVTAYAEPCGGPGWSNSPVAVIIKDKETGVIREDMIQPEEQSATMLEIYGFSALAHSKMVREAKRVIDEYDS